MDADLEKIVIGNDQQMIHNQEGREQKSLTIDLEETLKKGAQNDYTLVSNDIVLIKNKKLSSSFLVIWFVSGVDGSDHGAVGA